MYIMKSIEALISLLFLTFMSYAVLSVHPSSPTMPYVYRVQIADDIWRVIILKYNGIPSLGSEKHRMLEKDLNKIGKETGICIYVGGIRTTNCRGIGGEHIITIHRWYVDTSGITPELKNVALTLKLPKG